MKKAIIAGLGTLMLSGCVAEYPADRDRYHENGHDREWHDYDNRRDADEHRQWQDGGGWHPDYHDDDGRR